MEGLERGSFQGLSNRQGCGPKTGGRVGRGQKEENREGNSKKEKVSREVIGGGGEGRDGGRAEGIKVRWKSFEENGIQRKTQEGKGEGRSDQRRSDQGRGA
jgi:hypothetical protein